MSMKFLLIASLSLIAANSFAAEESLAKMKSKANEHFAKHAEILDTAKTCVNDAKTKEAYKACKYDMMMAIETEKFKMKEEKADKDSK